MQLNSSLFERIELNLFFELEFVSAFNCGMLLSKELTFD